VRLEVAAGLERDIRVVPVLVEGATMPRAHELPEPLRRLARRNALEITDTRWRHDVGRLVETIKKVLEGKGTGEAIREAEAEVSHAPVADAPPAAEAPASPARSPWESTPAPAAQAPPSHATAAGSHEPTTPPYQYGTPGAYQPPPPPGEGAWQAPSSAYYTARTPTANTKATWALVLGIVSVLTWWLAGLGIGAAIPAIILGAQAKGAAERGEVLGGLGIAKGAIWTGVAGILLAILFWVLIGIDISNDP